MISITSILAEITLCENDIITLAAVLAALIAITGYGLKIHTWYLKQEKQDNDIKQMKSEQCLLTYGVLACLKGLKEQGCNGPVTEAIDKLDKHLNKAAHDMSD